MVTSSKTFACSMASEVIASRTALASRYICLTWFAPAEFNWISSADATACWNSSNASCASCITKIWKSASKRFSSWMTNLKRCACFNSKIWNPRPDACEIASSTFAKSRESIAAFKIGLNLIQRSRKRRVKTRRQYFWV